MSSALVALKKNGFTAAVVAGGAMTLALARVKDTNRWTKKEAPKFWFNNIQIKWTMTPTSTNLLYNKQQASQQWTRTPGLRKTRCLRFVAAMMDALTNRPFA